jgi:hypothetical protein
MGFLDRVKGGKRTVDEDAILRTRRLIKDHLKRQERTGQRLWELARRALQLDDQRQFEQIARQYVWTIEDIARWRRYQLVLDTTAIRRDQARAVGVFMRSVQGLSGALLAGADRESRQALEIDLAQGVERAEDLEEVMDRLLMLTQDTVVAMGRVRPLESEPLLDEIEAAISRHGGVPAAEEGLDARVAEGMRLIAQEADRTRRDPEWERAAHLVDG